MNARPSASGVIHMSLMLPGDDAPSGLALELAGRREPGDQARAMSVKQVLFERRASLPARGPLRAMRFERDFNRRRLVIVDTDREMTWDVTVPSAPTLLSSMARQADKDSERIVVHTGKRVGTEPTRNLRRALEGLRDRLGRVEAVGSLRVAGSAETLYLRTDSGATLFDISRPDEPRELHVYRTPAWYEGAALGGNLMARLDVDLTPSCCTRARAVICPNPQSG